MSTIAELGSRAGALEREGRFTDAEDVLREILERQPHNPSARYALAILLLRLGRWEEGWAKYEARVEKPELNIVQPAPSCPRWDGGPVGSLLIWFEQGLGDQIMFARWIPQLVQRGIRVTFVCSPPLARLFSGLGCSIVPAEGSFSIPRHEAWCLVGSLPHLVGGMPDGEYLPGASGGHGIGVAVRGNPQHPGDALRSLPEPYAAELLAHGRSLLPEDTRAQDVEDGRRIVAGLSQVITVDTSFVHLAGAMGKPTTLLLAHLPDWRWGLGDANAWYRSVTIIRQPRHGDWAGVFVQLRDAQGWT